MSPFAPRSFTSFQEAQIPLHPDVPRRTARQKRQREGWVFPVGNNFCSLPSKKIENETLLIIYYLLKK